MSSLLKALVGSSGEFELGDAQGVELKGLAGSHGLFDVDWHVSLIHNSTGGEVNDHPRSVA